MKRNLISAILVLCMALTLLPGTAVAAETASGKCGENVTWSFQDGVMTISGTGAMENYNFNYNEKTDQYEPIRPWENMLSKITKVIVKEGVTVVGTYAFASCENVTSVEFPEGLTTIEYCAFNDTDLSSVTFPKSLRNIEAGAFNNNDNLTNVVFPEGLTHIGYLSFGACNNLKSVTIPASVTEIDMSALSVDITDLYFTGTEAQWPIEKAFVGQEELYLDWIGCPFATVHYNSKAPESPAAPSTPSAPSTPAASAAPAFTDVAATSPFAAAIGWAVEQKITQGTTATTFAPGSDCTRAQIATFLWRAQGSPEPRSSETLFTDVTDTGAYYYKAVQWAGEKGMVMDDAFRPGDPCTRADAVYFIWKANGGKLAERAPFSDVPEDAPYASAVNWAVATGVTQGTSADTFSPDTPCTRGQIVTFLYRNLAR